MTEDDIIKEFKEIIKNKISKSNKVDWISFVFNKSKEFNKHREIIIKQMEYLGISKITEYVYLFMNSIEFPPKCQYCNKNRYFGKYGKGYGKTCGSNVCRSQNMSIKHLGRVKSVETCQRISKALKGIKRTEENKLNISISRLKSSKRFWTDDRKKKMSDTMKAKFKTDEKFKNNVLKQMSNCVELAKSEKSKTKRKETLTKKFGVNNAGRLVKTLYYSKISQDLFNRLIPFLNKENCFYATNNGEKRILVNNTCYFPDFIYKNFIIEFNGDVYHANPLIYSSMDTPNPHYKNKTSQDIWTSDKKRLDTFKQLGYKVYVVWEKEYKENREKIVNYLISELKNV